MTVQAVTVQQPADGEPDAFTEKVEALRRLSPVKVRVLSLITDEMIREAKAQHRHVDA